MVALGLPSAGHGSAATAHIPPVLVGYRGMQLHPLALRERGKLHGEENKNAQLRFSSCQELKYWLGIGLRALCEIQLGLS